jgi:hypothetical protein
MMSRMVVSDPSPWTNLSEYGMDYLYLAKMVRKINVFPETQVADLNTIDATFLY